MEVSPEFVGYIGSNCARPV